MVAVSQFVYDAWWSMLTPDKEFPKEVRRILNTAFGELAGRAREIDMKEMLLRWGQSKVLAKFGHLKSIISTWGPD